MSHTVQALHARWVIPVEPANTVLDHHTVVIEDSLITAIVPTAEWRNTGEHVDEIHLPEHALIPGLVNAHTHAAMVLLRGRKSYTTRLRIFSSAVELVRGASGGNNSYSSI